MNGDIITDISESEQNKQKLLSVELNIQMMRKIINKIKNISNRLNGETVKMTIKLSRGTGSARSGLDCTFRLSCSDRFVQTD